MQRNILAKLVRCTETPLPKFVLITDSSEVCGRGLLWSIVKTHLASNAAITYLSTELSAKAISRGINSEDKTFNFIDGIKDPCGWDGEETNRNLSRPLSEVLGCEWTGGGAQKTVLVVDSLQHILIHQNPSLLLRHLHRLSLDDSVHQILVLCGRDVAGDNTLTALHHISSAILHVLPTNPCSCKLLVKKPSGKIMKTQEDFSLNSDLQIEILKSLEKSVATSTPHDTEADVILAAQTTFSLALTQDQRRAKNNLLLPHTRIQSSGGQIHYTPDDVDDWDEDDPDDDLDI